MKARLLLLVAVCGCALLPAAVGHAASGSSALILAASANARLQVIDVSRTLTPTAADYSNDYVEITGAAGLRVQVGTNSNTGCVLYVKCADAAPQIALADILFKTSTLPGAGGTSRTTYAPVTASDQMLWTSGSKVLGWVTVYTDIRIQNLFSYGDAIGAGTTNYTDNLTFTVVAQ